LKKWATNTVSSQTDNTKRFIIFGATINASSNPVIEIRISATVKMKNANKRCFGLSRMI